MTPLSSSGNGPDASVKQQEYRLLPWVVGIAFFMQMLDMSILNTALPTIAEDLKASPLAMHSVVVAYMLAVATFIPASGWLADRFGARRIFLLAISVFTFGSLACALSPTLPALVAARILQGIGGALLVPVGRLCILRAYPREELVKTLSFIAIPALIGPLMGPALGGFLVSYATWHWIFLINIPVGIIGTLLTLRVMPPLFAEEPPAPFDWLGFCLFGTFMITATLALEGTASGTAGNTEGTALSVTAGASLALYILYARRAKAPLFSPALFRTRNFTVGMLGNLFARLGMGAMPFLVPLLLQVGLGYSPLKAGLTLLPISLGAMVAKSFVNRLIRYLGYRWFLFFNTVAVGLMLAAYTRIGADTPYLSLLAFLGAAGIFNSLQFTGMNTLTLLDLPDKEAGSGNSLLSAVMQLSMGMGVAGAGALLNLFNNTGQGVLGAFHNTFFILSAFGIFSAFIFLYARDTQGRIAKQRPPLPPVPPTKESP